MFLVKFDVRWKPVFLTFLSTALQENVWLEKRDFDFLLYSYLPHVQDPIRTIVLLHEICPSIFHFVGLMQSLPMRELPTTAFVIYHNFLLTTLGYRCLIPHYHYWLVTDSTNPDWKPTIVKKWWTLTMVQNATFTTTDVKCESHIMRR